MMQSAVTAGTTTCLWRFRKEPYAFPPCFRLCNSLRPDKKQTKNQGTANMQLYYYSKAYILYT